MTRERLFALVADFAAHGGRKTLMVLDGKGPAADLASCETAYFSVMYSGAATADTYIERYLCENKQRVSFVVVTGDNAIARLALGWGARVKRADEFLELLAEAEKERADRLFQDKIKGHGFNRPFGDKL